MMERAGLSRQRQGHRTLRPQDHGEQRWLGAPAGDHVERRRRLGNGFTGLTTEALAHGLLHEESAANDLPVSR
jgi:hypothetical protein